MEKDFALYLYRCVFDKHLPLYDYDNDGFTDIVGFRGLGSQTILDQ